MKIKPLGKLIVLILVIGVAYGAYRLMSGTAAGSDMISKIMPGAKTSAAAVPIKADLPQIGDAAPPYQASNISLPSDTAANLSTPEVRFLGYAWNAQMGLMFANGGPKTTEGSLMADRKVNLNIARQDDNDKLQQALVAFATDLSHGTSQPTSGAHFVAVMGDGSATFLAGLNDQLKKIGPEYTAKIVTSAGFSRGEDKFMGPQAWKDLPTNAMGGVVAGVIRDGDWNIAEKWLGDNNLKNNSDEKTYDPDALNWIGASDYIDAATKYITGYKETRDVVKNGVKTGEKKEITVQGVVTWTPGDVDVAEKKGGIVPIVSTQQYSAQMPCVIIGIDKWCKDNRDTVDAFVDAINRGGDAVKSSSDALKKASEISAKVYGEQTGDYWAKYYKGTTEADKTGTQVSLGGSSVNNLADNMMVFGLAPGSANSFAATYTVFGNIVKAQYPDLVPSFPAADQIMDPSYLQDVAKKNNFDTAQMGEQKPIDKAPPTTIVSSKNWNIPFQTGSANLSPEASQTMQELLNDLLVAQNTVVELHGHTDNQGTPDKNMALSEARAFAVKKWLEEKAPRNFPEGRIRVFSHGQEMPLAENSTAEGRAKNRRVEIKLGAR